MAKSRTSSWALESDRLAGFGLALGLAMLRGPASPKSISLAVQPSSPASGSPHSTTWGLRARKLNLWRARTVAPLAAHDYSAS